MKGFAHESTANESKEWYTPKYIFDALGQQFDMDVCSPGADVVPWIPAEKHLTILDDGLSSKWGGVVWMNPTYGMDTPKWMRRLKEHGEGIGLVFARTDTNWFHDHAACADAILFVAKRVQFIQATQAQLYAGGGKIKNSGSGAGSMLIAYGKQSMYALQLAEEKGLGKIFIPFSDWKNEEDAPDEEIRHCEMDRNGDGSGVEADVPTAIPYVNSPANAETSSWLLF